MKSKYFEGLFYSAGGVIILLILLLAVNVIGARAKARLDLTADKLYTLSDGTKRIIQKIDTPVKIRFYFSQSDNSIPPFVKSYAQHVLDLLDEYRLLSKGKIQVEKYDPKPDSDAEDSAHLDGIDGEQISATDRIYFGLVVNQLDEKVTIPFLSPDRERLLEYDISRAISRVMTTERPTIGVMSGMPVFGAAMNPMMMRMGGGQATEPWVFYSELKNDFNVKQVELTADKIDDDIKVLVVIHPRGITSRTEFAIDQFLMRGGRLIAFLDPNPYFDKSGNQNPMMPMPGQGSTFPTLLKAWGIDFDPSKIVADMTYKSQTGQGGFSPTIITLNSDAIDPTDPATSQIDKLVMAFAGTFSGTPVAGLKQTVLAKTSLESQMVDRFTGQMAADQVIRDFKSGNKELPLAVRLSGKFKTAFPDGQPKDDAPKPDEPKDAVASKTNEPPATASIKESTSETMAVLVGDADMLNDLLSVEVMNILGQKMVQLKSGNMPFLQNLVEQASGDNNLISVRSRASLSRPFIRVQKMEAAAEEKFQSRLKSLQDSLEEAQRRVTELQQNKEKGQRFIMSPEQQKELEDFRKKERDTKAELNKLRKELRHEIDSLENRVKWVNIVGMPLAVVVFGLALAGVKRKRTAAK